MALAWIVCLLGRSGKMRPQPPWWVNYKRIRELRDVTSAQLICNVM